MNITTTRHNKLVKAIREYLASVDVRIDGLPPMFADVDIWHPGNRPELLGGAAVVLTYDGAGFEFLSASGHLAYLGSHRHREAIYAIAQKLGYDADDHNSWSMGFYR